MRPPLRLIVIGTLSLLAILALAWSAATVIRQQRSGAEGEARQDFFSALFPFLGGGQQGPFPEPNIEPGEGISDQQAPLLRQVWPEPVSGFGIISRGEETYIQYLDRATGHMYESRIDTLGSERTTNTTIPRVLEALWVADGQTILRYLDAEGRLITFSASTTSSTEDGGANLSGRFLESDITALAVRPDGKKIFYLVSGTGSTVGYEANPDGSGRRAIFESPLREWKVEWPAAPYITLATKASGGANGTAFVLNPSTSALKKIVDTLPGLMVRLAKDGNVAFITSTDAGYAQTWFTDMRTGLYGNSALEALPEKCVSAEDEVWFCGSAQSDPGQLLPDAWYQGRFSFNDDIWATRRGYDFVEFIARTSENVPGGLDLVNPTLSPDEEYLVFMNKKDLSLWSLRLVEPQAEAAAEAAGENE
jgi:hypothetical protein